MSTDVLRGYCPRHGYFDPEGDSLRPCPACTVIGGDELHVALADLTEARAEVERLRLHAEWAVCTVHAAHHRGAMPWRDCGELPCCSAACVLGEAAKKTP